RRPDRDDAAACWRSAFHRPRTGRSLRCRIFRTWRLSNGGKDQHDVQRIEGTLVYRIESEVSTERKTTRDPRHQQYCRAEIGDLPEEGEAEAAEREECGAQRRDSCSHEDSEAQQDDHFAIDRPPRAEDPDQQGLTRKPKDAESEDS